LKSPSLSLLRPNNRSQFRRLVDDLCTKAPQAAELLGTKIIESAGRSGRPEDTIERPAAKSAAPDHIIAQSRKRKLEDCTYRPPKHAKTNKRTDARYPLVENGAIHQSARLAGGKLSKVSGTTDDKALPGSAKLTSASAKPDAPKPLTPTQAKASVIVFTQTEEIQRGKIPTSLEITRSSPVSMSVAPEDACTLTDHILEAARIIHRLSKYPDGMLRQVYVTILQALRDSRKDVLVSSDWSTGSMWVDILEAGSVENQKVTILNMLECIGTWE
jgi:hypothetical protein